MDDDYVSSSPRPYLTSTPGTGIFLRSHITRRNGNAVEPIPFALDEEARLESNMAYYDSRAPDTFKHDIFGRLRIILP